MNRRNISEYPREQYPNSFEKVKLYWFGNPFSNRYKGLLWEICTGFRLSYETRGLDLLRMKVVIEEAKLLPTKSDCL